MMYIQQQNVNVAKKMMQVSATDVRYFHLDIPVKCEFQEGVVGIIYTEQIHVKFVACECERAETLQIRVA